MEVISHTIKHARPDIFSIYPLGDIHIGVAHCDEELLRRKVQKIKENPFARWIGMGDYGDLVVPSDFKRWDGAILAPWMKGQEDNIGPTQLRAVDSILSPIWGQCLGLIEGNHDTAIAKHTHYNFMKELLILANKKHTVPYAGVSCFIRLNFVRCNNHGPTHDYIIHARHGEGAARTSGARALAVLRLASSMVNAHLTLSGHLHGMESPDIPQRIILKDGRIKAFGALATMTGAWLKAYAEGVPPCYLERWGTPPSKLGCPRIDIEPDKDRHELRKSDEIRSLS